MECLAEDCTHKPVTKGFCNMHYKRLLRGGTLAKRNAEKLNQTKLPEYHIWSNIKYRCNNLNSPVYGDYGGRGIKICDRWANSFFNFYQDMGKRPSPKYQVDRVDNNGNYEPSNCKWVTPQENSQHKTNSKLDIPSVLKIKRLLSDKVPSVQIASLFNVSSSSICLIKQGKHWSNLKDPNQQEFLEEK